VLEAQFYSYRFGAVIADTHSFIERVLAQNNETADMDGVTRQQGTVRARQVRVRQVDGEKRVVLADPGGEQQRSLPFHGDGDAREVARVEVEKPFRRLAQGLSVTVVVEDKEAVAAFERARTIEGKGCRRSGGDGELLIL
jgi:hypothetical protein